MVTEEFRRSEAGEKAKESLGKPYEVKVKMGPNEISFIGIDYMEDLGTNIRDQADKMVESLKELNPDVIVPSYYTPRMARMGEALGLHKYANVLNSLDTNSDIINAFRRFERVYPKGKEIRLLDPARDADWYPFNINAALYNGVGIVSVLTSILPISPIIRGAIGFSRKSDCKDSPFKWVNNKRGESKFDLNDKTFDLNTLGEYEPKVRDAVIAQHLINLSKGPDSEGNPRKFTLIMSYHHIQPVIDMINNEKERQKALDLLKSVKSQFRGTSKLGTIEVYST